MQDCSKKDIEEMLGEEGINVLYLYTPMCGTCQVAGRMLTIVQELTPHMTFRKIDLNYIPDLAEKWSVESVPCLLIFRGSNIEQKIYAFHSVPYLYETIRSIS
ncbi:thioredoxin family protein [Cytobacillus sp. FJAT-54145]|uniref:Thioredoxin family protein n=1 Tax=Cytobacillus spartinae TaxID=3299023 RepID=A0ABW6KDR7_9BACI